MKRVVLEEGELVGLAPGRRLHVEVVELVGRAAGGGVDEPLAVARHVGSRAIKRLLAQDGRGVPDTAFQRRHPDRVSGAERRAAVRDQQQLLAAREPRGGEMHVPWPEIQPVAPEVVVGRDRHLVPGPQAVGHRPHRHVEVAVRPGRHVADPVAIGRERRVAVDVCITGQRPGLTALDIEELQLYPRAVVIGGVDDPSAVGGPVGGGMIRLGAVRQLVRDARVGGRPARSSRSWPPRSTRRPAPSSAPRASSWGKAGSRSCACSCRHAAMRGSAPPGQATRLRSRPS